MKLSESKYAISYKSVIDRKLPPGQAQKVWQQAEKNFDDLMQENPNQTKAAAEHTYVSIFPAISIYKAMQSCGVEDAMSIMEEGAARLSAKRGKTYAGMLKIPGMKSLFLKIFATGMRSGFGPEAGFAERFITENSRELKVDVTKCPYTDYCAKYGCPELVHVFCKNDEYAYGNLPGIQFLRTQTLGTGGQCCDFHFKRS
jgi:hypothetical protein